MDEEIEDEQKIKIICKKNLDFGIGLSNPYVVGDYYCFNYLNVQLQVFLSLSEEELHNVMKKFGGVMACMSIEGISLFEAKFFIFINKEDADIAMDWVNSRLVMKKLINKKEKEEEY